ncbi:putative lipid II flippase FtsW [bacterium]|jgi:cell division protein FtsW|nr:putative lipid II flippase FtsW [bacterium]
MRFIRRQLLADLKILLCLISTLIIIGMLFIYSSSSVFALDRFGSAHYFVKKQIFGLFFGLVGLFIFSILPLEFLRKLSPFLFFGSLGLTAMTLIPKFATTIHGSSRWLSLAGFSFQPSELLKISFIVYLAHIISKKEQKLFSFIYGYLPFLIILGITALVLLKQPDFGLTVTLCATAFLLFFVAECKSKYLIITLLSSIPAIVALVWFKPYRLQRFLTFLDPWKDPKGSGFQIIQSLIAIGSGNWIGAGIAQSKQKFFYLPMQHTDFIFSIIAEETGFIGCTILITLYVFLIYFGMRIAWSLKETFSSFAVLGFTILVGLQSLTNFFVSVGLLPTKGIGLPFVSFGSSGLVALLCLLGVIINCVLEVRI